MYVGAALPPLTKSDRQAMYVGAALPPLKQSDTRCYWVIKEVTMVKRLKVDGDCMVSIGSEDVRADPDLGRAWQSKIVLTGHGLLQAC